MISTLVLCVIEIILGDIGVLCGHPMSSWWSSRGAAFFDRRRTSGRRRSQVHDLVDLAPLLQDGVPADIPMSAARTPRRWHIGPL